MRQKGKHLKRLKSWHRGKTEFFRWEKAMKKLNKVIKESTNGN